VTGITTNQSPLLKYPGGYLQLAVGIPTGYRYVLVCALGGDMPEIDAIAVIMLETPTLGDRSYLGSEPMAVPVTVPHAA
jgi:hypothetical protein